MRPPFLILQTGRPVASMRRHRSFAHWIRVAAGLGGDDVVVVDVQDGGPLPTREGFAGVIVTGSGAMVKATLKTLAELQVPAIRIKYDSFTDQ